MPQQHPALVVGQERQVHLVSVVSVAWVYSAKHYLARKMPRGHPRRCPKFRVHHRDQGHSDLAGSSYLASHAIPSGLKVQQQAYNL
jgi:hypothetical protein